MDTLVEFLLKNIDDDRDRADVEALLREGDPYYQEGGESTVFERRFSPERVMCDSEAKLKIAMMHVSTRTENPSVKVCSGCGEPRVPTRPGCQTLRLMASVYRERPDYKDAWKP